MLNSNKTPDIFGGGLQADFVAEKRAPMPAAREREDSRRALRGAAAPLVPLPNIRPQAWVLALVLQVQ